MKIILVILPPTLPGRGDTGGMTPALPHAHWSGAPSPTHHWMGALLRAVAMLVSFAASILRMPPSRLPRECHTDVTPARLPKETSGQPETHLAAPDSHANPADNPPRSHSRACPENPGWLNQGIVLLPRTGEAQRQLAEERSRPGGGQLPRSTARPVPHPTVVSDPSERASPPPFGGGESPCSLRAERGFSSGISAPKHSFRSRSRNSAGLQPPHAAHFAGDRTYARCRLCKRLDFHLHVAGARMQQVRPVSHHPHMSAPEHEIAAPEA